MKQEEPAAVTRIREMFRLAHEEAATIIGEVEDPDEAFRATELLDVDLQRLHHEKMTKLKARGARRLRKKYDLSLLDLAKRTNRSVSGVARLVKIAKENEEAPCPSSAT